MLMVCSAHLRARWLDLHRSVICFVDPIYHALLAHECGHLPIPTPTLASLNEYEWLTRVLHLSLPGFHPSSKMAPTLGAVLWHHPSVTGCAHLARSPRWWRFTSGDSFLSPCPLPSQPSTNSLLTSLAHPQRRHHTPCGEVFKGSLRLIH